MKDFFLDLISEMRYGGTSGFFMGLIMFILIGFLIIILSMGLYLLVDSSYLKIYEGNGVIVKYEFVPEHTDTHHHKIGNVSTVTTSHINDAWFVTIEMDGKTDEIEVCQEYYNDTKFHVDQELYPIVKFKYAIGRLSNNLYVTKIIE